MSAKSLTAMQSTSFFVVFENCSTVRGTKDYQVFGGILNHDQLLSLDLNSVAILNYN